MSQSASQKPPVWYWVITVLGLIWYGLGVNYYLQQAYNTTYYRAMYSPEQLMVVDKMPAWAIAAFALGVFSGLIGVFGLLLRKSWAKWFFILSVVSIAIQYIYYIFIGKMYELFSVTENVRYFIIPIIAYLLFYITKQVEHRPWFNRG
jgi:hypothetical protein